ncbi:nuclear envelope phosphatase-regulatory subunit 1 [Trichonephila clavipes]|nr:nuclear envelope phosphatase-regulatory subunit 1 [Trichonephila clavipes]
MTLEQTTCEDLKAFERRLVEVIAYYQPQTKRWRVMFVVVALCTAIGAWQWLTDPLTSQVGFVQSLVNHLFFTISSAVLITLFVMGIHRRVVAPSMYPFQKFVEWAQNELAVVPDFHKRILFSDEAHFWLNGYVNKQNCRIWSEANPQVYVETPLHPEKLTVWCALWAGGIIGPYFFKNDEGHNVTVNGDRYRAMITNFFIPELNNHDVQELWFQQDGATCHTARATIDLLKDTFGDRLISRFGPVNWPPRSCDLTPLDYFLWGYVKSLVYADKPQTLDQLEDNIRCVIADIRPQMLEKVIENWTSRLDYIRGSPMPEITFKIVRQVLADFNMSCDDNGRLILKPRPTT